MPTDIVVPQLGESISEAVVAAWLKNDGDYVDRDEEIVELETDKVTMPLPAPVAGVLKRAVEEGDTIEVGSSVGTIDESAEKPAGGSGDAKADEPAQAAAGSSDAAAPTPKASTTVAEPPESKADSAPADKAPPAHATSAGSPAPDPGDHAPSAGRATPLARKIAQEHGVDLSALKGTGPGGRVREQDVLAAFHARSNGSAAPAPAAAPAQTAAKSGGDPGPPSRGVRRERMSQLRQRIAVRLVEAQHTAAMLTTFNECDMTDVMALRSRHKEAFEKAHGVRLGFMSFFVKAAVSALEKFPAVNASIVDGEKGPEVEYHDYCDVAVAVGTEKGLVVPVVRNCESRSFAGVEAGIAELAEKAKKNTLTLDDLQGGTFTISNGGVYGSMMSTPILNPPQSGILGMHNIIRRPVERPDKPGSGEVAVRPMMYLALSYDHRIVDGAGAVGFLKHIKECIEDPERLLLEV